MLAIGLMSGTSLDGVDCVLCEITGINETTRVKQIDFLTYPFDSDLKKRCLEVLTLHQSSTRALCSLNFELGYIFSKAVIEILKRNQLESTEVSFIASHGQTIYHLPQPNPNEYASTLQLGEAAVIAYECRIQVISNFRVMDMAAGGQGAPLVPFSELILYGQTKDRTALLNLGGIANISFLDSIKPIAFDTGPANMMIDEAMRYFFQKEYDQNGDIAWVGQIHDALLNELKSHPYLTMSYPKSTGRESFGSAYVHSLLKKYSDVKAEDIIRTFTYFTSYCVYQSIQAYNKPLDRLILSGGGAHNSLIKHDLKVLNPGVDVITQEDLGYSSDAKEAIAFVVLANQTLHQQSSNVISVTGAKQAVILGNITMVPY